MAPLFLLFVTIFVFNYLLIAQCNDTVEAVVSNHGQLQVEDLKINKNENCFFHHMEPSSSSHAGFHTGDLVEVCLMEKKDSDVVLSNNIANDLVAPTNKVRNEITFMSTITLLSRQDVYVDTTLDFASDVASCQDSSNTNTICNLRSALALCAVIIESSLDECMVHLPLSSVITIDSNLGEIGLTNVAGTIVIIGNGCSIVPLDINHASSRFMKIDILYHFHLENVFISSFGQGEFQIKITRCIC